MAADHTTPMSANADIAPMSTNADMGGELRRRCSTSTSDIATRLRIIHCAADDLTPRRTCLICQAADEIERLLTMVNAVEDLHDTTSTNDPRCSSCGEWPCPTHLIVCGECGETHHV